jgi:hypothetical protein
MSIFLLSACHVFERPEIRFTCDDIPECADADTDTEPTDEDCGDGVDNDQDGLTDCEDEDCLDECIEDCGDGIDNDQDGLTDCEDEDCLEACIEDCTDQTDNDQDGFADCDDDECYGIDGCGGPYQMLMQTRFETLATVMGTELDEWQPNYSYNIAMMSSGTIEISASPSGWSGGEAFSCTGTIFGGFNIASDFTPYDAFTYVGPVTGVDYALAMTPNTTDYTLIWSPPSDCPLETLPYVLLGFSSGSSIVYRESEGSWIPQYYSLQYAYQQNYKGYDLRLTSLYGVYPYNLIEWTGTY